MRVLGWVSLVFAAILFASCGGGGASGAGTAGINGTNGTSGTGAGGGAGGTEGSALRILATDAPFSFNSVKSATVSVEKIELRNQATGAFTTLVDFSASGGKSLDLVTLKNGAVDELYSGDPAPGTYDLVRIVVNAEQVTIDDGGKDRMFDNFKVPSGPQTGIKIFVSPPITVTTSLTKDLVLDFDLSRSFVVQGNPHTPAGIKGFLFKPVIRAVNASTAGSLTLRVKSDNATPDDTSDDYYLDGVDWTLTTTDSSATEVASGTSGENPSDPTMKGYVYQSAVPAGVYTLTLENDYYDTYTASVSFTAANLTDLGTITLAQSVTELSGVVTTKITTTGGEELDLVVPGATVTAMPTGTTVAAGTDTTDNAGEYSIPSLPAGPYDLKVTADGYEDGTQTDISLGAGGAASVEQDFVLTAKTADVTGTVTESDGTTAISGATVEAIMSYGGADKVIATTTTASDGTYTLSNVPTGSYTIKVTTSETTPRTATSSLDLVGGGSAATVDIKVS